MDLALIHKRLRGLALKRAGFALGVCGAAGIGKTHAVSKLLQDAPCAFQSHHASTSLSALLQNLPKPRALPAWALAITEKLERGEFVEDAALLDAIQATLSLSAPLILHLEDIHEVSADRLEWLGKLADAVKRTRGVALIVTSRSPPPEAFEAVSLEPLSKDETRALLEAEVAAPLPTEALSWIYSRAAGNPLFSLEFFRHLARQGFAWNDGRRWHWRAPPSDTLPVTIEALIEQLLIGAADTANLETVLAVRALLPVSSSDALCATVADLEIADFKLAQAELERRGVLKSGEFAHPLYREVARQRQTSQQRQQWAGKLIANLSVAQPLEALEFMDEARLEGVVAVSLLERAAAQARRIGDWQRLKDVLRKYVAQLPSPICAEVALAASDEFTERDGVFAAEMDQIALAVFPTRKDLAVRVAFSLARSGDIAAAQRLIDQHVLDESQHIADSIQALSFAKRHQEALALRDRHVDRLTPLMTPELYYRIAYSLAMMDRAEEATALTTLGLDWPDLQPLQRSDLLGVQAMSAFKLGFVENALERFQAQLPIIQLSQNPLKLGTQYFNISVVLTELGRFEESIEATRLAALSYSEAGLIQRAADVMLVFGNSLTNLGRYEEAETQLLTARAMLNGLNLASLISAENFLSYLYSVWKTPNAKLHHYKHARLAVDYARRHGNTSHLLNALINLVAAELEFGQHQRALGLGEEMLALIDGHTLPKDRVLVQMANAAIEEALGERSVALASFRVALDIAQSFELPLERQLVSMEINRLGGDLSAAQAQLHWFEQRGHRSEIAKLLTYFPQLAPTEPAEEPTVYTVRLEVLGAIQIDGVAVRGRKRQELLAALLEARIAGRAEVTRLELLDALYPDEDEDRAGSSLKELVRSTRASLGAQTIQTTANGYALGAVNSDAEVFLETGNTSLWRGAYLGGLSSADDAVRESLHLALSLQAEQHLESDPKEAARLGRLLLEFDPYSQTYLQLTLSALRVSDHHGKALQRLYSTARDRLIEVGEALPERWQDFLLETATA